MKVILLVSHSFSGKWALLLPFLLLLTSCETFQQCPDGNCPGDEEVLAESGAIRLTPEQVRARNVGNTEEWLRGGAYYRADGTMRARWRGLFYNGTWEVEADGTLCFQLPSWQSRCHFYMEKGDDVYLLDEGRSIGVSHTFSGDQLRTIGTRQPHRDNRTR